jgi:hypothetical protein
MSNFKRSWKDIGQTYLLFVVSILDHQKTLSEKNLELLYEEVLRIIDANKRADDVAWFVRSEICRLDQLQTAWGIKMMGPHLDQRRWARAPNLDLCSHQPERSAAVGWVRHHQPTNHRSRRLPRGWQRYSE